MAPQGGSRPVSRDAHRPGDPLPREIVPPEAAAVNEAFAAETRRVMVRRVPLGVLCFIGIVAVAGLMEVSYYPDRFGAFGVSLFLGRRAIERREYVLEQ